MQYLDLAIRANAVQSRHVSVTLFESMEPLLRSLDDDNTKLLKPKESQIASRVKALLFKPQYASYGIDAKLKRAKLVTAAFGVPLEALREQICGNALDEDIASEPSGAVKEELKKARGMK